jgi:hypothetical protein
MIWIKLSVRVLNFYKQRQVDPILKCTTILYKSVITLLFDAL